MGFLKNIFNSKQEEPVSSYADFWSWFIRHEKSFHKVIDESLNTEADFINKLMPKLDQLNEGFYIVAGMYDDQTAEVIFTAEGVIKNLIFVEELVSAAPSIPGWKFTAHKPESDISNIEINMEDIVFSKDNLNFYSNEREEYPDEIDITVVHDNYNEDNKDLIANGSFIFIDNLLGELNSVSIIDHVDFIAPSEAVRELVPIEKLKDFVKWRQKEFGEKYEGTRHDTENDTHTTIEAELASGNNLFAVINADLMKWDAKASHPWLLKTDVIYDGTENNGMPDEATYALLDEMEEEMLIKLKDSEGYLYVGRQTSNNLRETYFACKEFRKSSKIMSEITRQYNEQLETSYEIYKDKYWMSLDYFITEYGVGMP